MRRTWTLPPAPSGVPSVRLPCRGAGRTTSVPICRVRPAPGAAGVTRSGGSGGPFLPHAGRRTASATPSAAAARPRRLEDVPAEVIVPDDVGQHAVHVGAIDAHGAL